MLTQTEEDAVVAKTRELCDAIVAQPNMKAIRRNIDAFLADEKARAAYESLMTKGQELHEKQHRSMPLTGEEISAFEKQRESVLNNPVSRGFLDAQQALQQVQEIVHKHVSKTLETGHVPTAEELASGSCGEGCGCHH